MTDSKKIDDGGPAYPQTTTSSWGGEASVDVTGGLSLRDWFAGQALAAACQFAFANGEQGSRMGHLPEEWASKIAYGCADAMLIARKGGDA